MNTQDRISKALKDNGAFFAFSKKQFDEQAIQGTKYTYCGSGMVAPKNKAKKLLEDLEQARLKGVKDRIAKHTLEEIIQYELANYECQYFFDEELILEVTKDYGATAEMIQEQYKIFFKRCCDEDLF